MSIYSSCKALIIGVSSYADPQYDLGYARSDGEAMAELLGGEFGFDQVWTLYDNDATRQSIIRFFEQDLQQVDEDDGLLIFFAGHGITVTSAIGDERGFLVPHDGNLKERYSNISLASIRDDYLPNIPAKHVLLIVDSCYGGLALRDVAAVERPKTIDDGVLAELTRRDRKVRQVISAGTKDQRVLDGGLFGRSVFTGRLIEALREADPYITADHIGVHVRERVARDSLDRKHRQTPQFGYLIGGEGSFVFARTENDNIPQAASIDTLQHSERVTVVLPEEFEEKPDPHRADAKPANAGFDVILKTPPAIERRIDVLRILRGLTGCDLPHAKSLLNCPSLLLKGVPLCKAIDARSRLVGYGCTVDIHATSPVNRIDECDNLDSTVPHASLQTVSRDRRQKSPVDVWLKFGLLLPAIVAVVIVIFILFLACIRPTPEPTVSVSPQQMVSHLQEALNALKSVRDEQSAIKARVQWEFIATNSSITDIRDLRPEPTPQERVRIADLVSQVAVEMKRVMANPKFKTAFERGQ